jgi:hypothetical protein
MLVRAPFAYSVDYFVHNGRKRVQRILIDHVERDVPEIGMEEAPVALTWQQRGRTMDIVRPSMVRYYDGQFYQSIIQSWINLGLDDRGAAHTLVVAPHEKRQKAALYSGETEGRYFDAVHHFLHGGNTAKRPKASEVEFDLGDDHDEQKSAAEERLGRFLLVDNAIWVRIHEPTLVVRADAPMARDPLLQRTIFTEAPRFSNFGAPPDAIAYSIDQTDRWMNQREPLAWETIKVCAENIRVEMPEAFRFDGVRNGMLRSVEAFLELLGPEIHAWDDGMIGKFVDTRRRLRAHLKHPTEFAIEDIAEDAYPLLARIERRTPALRTVWRAFDHALAEEPSIEIDFAAHG